MDVSVIIVNYNTMEITLNCINSIFEHTKDISFEVILVDNASTDGSKEYFEKDTRVVYVYNDENIGFGRANNIGYTYAKGKYLFFLNSDTTLLNNALKMFFIHAERRKNVDAIYGTILLDVNNNVNSSYGQFYTWKEHLLGLIELYFGKFKFIKNKYLFKRKEFGFVNDEMLVDWIIGADLFIPRLIFDKIHFNPAFFMYCEEVYLQYKLKKMNISSIIIRTPKIIHFGGESSSKESLEIPRNYAKSICIYYKFTSSKIQFCCFYIFRILLFLPYILFSNKTFEYKCNYLKSLL